MTRRRFRTDDDLFEVFYLAEKLHKTVAELLLGSPSPITALECRLWRAYWVIKNEHEEKNDKASGTGSGRKKMLGQQE